MSVSGRLRPGATRVAITSGKGGVGKTSVTVNLATALARMGHRVGVLDADFGLGNVDVMLGMSPGAHVGSVLAGDKRLDEVVVTLPSGVRVIPAGSGVRALTALTAPQWARLGTAIDELARDLDFLIIDTAPGIDDHVFQLARLADEVIVVASPEPTAIVDAYAMVKLLVAAIPEAPIGVVVNAARDAAQANLVFLQIVTAAKRFLGRSITSYGFVVRDGRVAQAVMDQEPVVTRDANAPASVCFRRLALRVANLLKPVPGPLRPRRAPAPVVRPSVMTCEEFAEVEAPRCA